MKTNRTQAGRKTFMDSLVGLQTKLENRAPLFSGYANPQGYGQRIANAGVGLANNIISKPMSGGYNLANVYKTALTEPMDREEQFQQFKKLLFAGGDIGTGIATSVGVGNPLRTAGALGGLTGAEYIKRRYQGQQPTGQDMANYGIGAFPKAASITGVGVGAENLIGGSFLGNFGKPGRQLQVGIHKALGPVADVNYFNNKGFTSPENYINNVRAYWPRK
jgi:hypothetical protein